MITSSLLQIGDCVTYNGSDHKGVVRPLEGVVVGLGQNACRVANQSGTKTQAVLISSIIRIHIPMGSFETVSKHLTEAAMI